MLALVEKPRQWPGLFQFSAMPGIGNIRKEASRGRVRRRLAFEKSWKLQLGPAPPPVSRTCRVACDRLRLGGSWLNRLGGDRLAFEVIPKCPTRSRRRRRTDAEPPGAQAHSIAPEVLDAGTGAHFARV